MSRLRISHVLPLLLLAGCARQPTTLAERPAPPAAITTMSSISATRADAIRGYEQFLQSARDPKLRAEALRRLADLRLEEGEAQAATGATAEEAGTEAAIALYQQRLRDFPSDPQNDRVRYQLARAYENLGQREAALAVLDQMVASHPGSALAAEAQFRRGEMLFVARDYRGAEAAYSDVIEHGDSNYAASARYKRGWTLFKQSQYPEAVDDFMGLLDLRARGGDLNLESLARAEREQSEDALRAISLGFSYLDGPASVADYYRSRDHRRHEDLVYRGLGELYLEKERYSDAAACFETFVAASPTHVKAPLFQLRAIEIYQQAGFSTEVLDGKQRFVQLYRFGGPYWRTRTPAEHPEVTAPLESTLRDLAGHFHSLAQKGKRPQDYLAAEEWYRQYLRDFNDRPGAQAMRFLYAELLFEQKDFAGAAEQYEHAAYDYGKEGRAAEAGYAALLAYEAHRKTLPAEDAANWEALALLSAERFAIAFPAHAQAAPALTHAAERMFARGDGAAARRLAEALISQVPGTTEPQRLSAWTIVGHTSFDEADYLKAEQAYQESLASPALAPAQRPALRERLAASIYRQGEQAREAGEPAVAVEHFLRVGRTVAETSIRANAEYDAAALLLQLKQWPRAIAVLTAFRADFPGHALQAEVTEKLAVAYLEDGRPGEAAAEFGRIAEVSGDPAIRREALLRSAELYTKAQSPAAAAAALQSYLADFPRPLTPAMEARQQLLEIYVAQGDGQAVRQTRRAIIQADREAGGERSERSRYLAAQSSLALAEDSLFGYQAVKLVAPVAANLGRKKTAMQTALKAYTDAADYGVAEVTTAATFTIADIYGDFGRSLMQSERPEDLDEDALEEYELLLEEEAIPFEEKAIELHEVNAARAAEGVYDQWVRKSFSALTRLLPARYAKAERKNDLVETLR